MVVETKAFLESCAPYLRPSSVQDYFKASWAFPQSKQHKATQLQYVFAHCGENDPSHIKPSASEMLTMYVMLRHFCELKLSTIPGMAAQKASFEACCDVIDTIMHIKRFGRGDLAQLAATLRRNVDDHMRLHQLAYGDQRVKPKHHRMMHIADQILRDSCVLDAFIIERLHNALRAVADNLCNTSRYEFSLLAGVLNNQLRTLEGRTYGDGLIGPTARHPDVLNAFVADKMEVATKLISVGDIVLSRPSFGRVVACVQEDDQLFATVRPFDFVSRLSRHSVRVREMLTAEVWPAGGIEELMAWYTDGDCVVVLHGGV